MSAARTLAAVLIVLLMAAPASAARPIVDLHKLDAYFALFAADSNVPWKATTIRLDTYSSAPVDIAVYQVDPANVLTAGSNARPRAIETKTLHAITRFTYTPPGGYQFQPNVVDLPLGDREGFFVIEARRGNVGEQVWINRTRIALIAKQTPAQLLLYGADLGTGMPLARLRVQLLVGEHFVTAYTDDRGIISWNGQERPIFALAQWGSSYASLSFLPQAPLPSAIVGVRTASAVVHAGESVHIVGFARIRRGEALRPASGTATLSLRDGAHLLDEQRAPLDAAGAFSASLAVPADASADDDAIIAQVGEGVGSASVRVDADANGLSLDVASECGDECDPNEDVPVVVRSSRPNVDVRVTVIRSPHVYVGEEPTGTPWGTTMWLDERVMTDGSGRAEVRIPHPTDDLSSTYGVRVESGGATAGTRIVVATAPVALRLQLDHDEETLGTPIGFTVYAADVRTGKPLADGRIDMTLSHGGLVQEQSTSLDDQGRAHGSFPNADLGTNMMTATIEWNGARAEDATQLEVVSQGSSDVVQGSSADVSVWVDRERYRAGDPIRVDASAPGSAGEALLTLEGAFGVQSSVVRVVGGHASAVFRAVDAPGAVDAGAAFVRDGSVATNGVPLTVEGTDRATTASLGIDPTPSAGADVTLMLQGTGNSPATFAVRLSSGEPSGSALFTSVPDLLAFDVSSTQTSAPESVTWHPWVDSTGDHPLVLDFVRRTEPPPDLTIVEADTHSVSWSITRGEGPLNVQLPAQPGHYTLSVLEIADDGRIVAASQSIDLP